jgi:hypothetical protein
MAMNRNIGQRISKSRGGSLEEMREGDGLRFLTVF